MLGARAPLLRLGGNRQYAALEQAGLLWDSSMVAPLSNPPYWPYPLAFAAPHRCYGDAQKFPTRSHNLYQMVMNEFDPREEPGQGRWRSRCRGVPWWTAVPRSGTRTTSTTSSLTTSSG